MNANNKLSAKTKLGYGIGQMGDSIGFNVFYFFFLFFLTDVIGMAPSLAGSISLIAVIWDAVTDPIIGHLSDNLNSKHGRRRPFMIGSAIPYAIVMFLLFSDVNLPMGAKNIYFIVISMLYWTAYTAFVIPYFALGAEITQDFEERTSLRVWASYFMYIAVMIASSAPPMIVEITTKAGGTVIGGWRNVGIIFGILTFTAIALCWRATKGKEIVIKRENVKKENLFKAYKEIFSLKCVKPLALSVLLWSLVSSMQSGGLVYLMTTNLEYGAERQSFVFMFLSIILMVWLPLINKLADKYDKKKVYMFTILFSSINFIAFYFIGFPAFILLLIEIAFFAFGNSSYWTLYYSMMYDISELDEFINEERREGGITAIMSFCQKLGAAIAMWLTGQILAWGQYGVEGASLASQQQAVLLSNTAVPGVIGVLSVIAIIGYPLTKDKFMAIKEALELKKAGKEYSTESFNELL